MGDPQNLATSVEEPARLFAQHCHMDTTPACAWTVSPLTEKPECVFHHNHSLQVTGGDVLLSRRDV